MSSPEGTEFVDYYALLGVSPTAEIAEIRRAYILRAKQHHPDAGGSTEMMKALNKAYKTLSDSAAKVTYDLKHSIQTGTTEAGDYKYAEGRRVETVDDMTDEEIDSFLDSLLSEYDAPANRKPNISEKFKQYFKRN